MSLRIPASLLAGVFRPFPTGQVFSSANCSRLQDYYRSLTPIGKNSLISNAIEIFYYDIGHNKSMISDILKAEVNFRPVARQGSLVMPARKGVVRLAGFEPTTPGSASQCSNPLSYKRKEAVS